MRRLTRLLLCLVPVASLLTSQSCAEDGADPDTMPKSAAWRETDVVTLGDSKVVRVRDYVVSNKDWAVTIGSGKKKMAVGKLDEALFPKSKAESVKKLSPMEVLPFVFSTYEWLKERGKMHREPNELTSKEPSKGELERDGDKFRLRYDDGLSFPREFTIWRKSGETTVITYSNFRKMDVADSRAEIVRLLAPMGKQKKR